MRKLHKFTALFLAAVMLAGCGMQGSNTPAKEPETQATQPTEQRQSESAKEAAPADQAAEAENELFTVDSLAGGMEPAVSNTMVEMAAFDAAYEDGYYVEPGEGFYEKEMNTEEYDYQKEHSFQSTVSAPLSTFAADVDTASYANIRRFILNHEDIPDGAVRIEEMVNYFHYDYPEPEDDDPAPFTVTTEIAPCPWNEDTRLLSIGLQAKKMDTKEMPKSNLVFLIDVSGSMDERNKLPLVQRSFMTLVENLDEQDTVSIVTYSSGEELVLDGVSADNKNQIMTAIENLYASGSTNGESAIQMAYETAKKHFIDGGNNRIIMATDGDFNVGITSEAELTRMIKENAKDGVFLSVLGYGMGNYKDNKLESLADNGNGNYAYIDSIDEARKVLIEEAGGTLFTVAKDVKLQVDFNPAEIKGYRLIGYENRTMAATDFADDTKDGGEIGAGHQVTALYEIVPINSEFEIPSAESKYTAQSESELGELLTVNVRYKAPDANESTLLEYPVTMKCYSDTMSDNMSWAAGVAQAGMLLSDSEYAGTSTYQDIKERLKPLASDDFRDEFIYMLGKMQ